jgi:hypothetical protein
MPQRRLAFRRVEAIIAGVLAVGIVAAAYVFIRTKGADPYFRPLVPGVIVTGVGLLAAIAMYVWLFDRTMCSDNGFACTVNANQGLLTGLGLLIAAGAIWTGALSNAAARRRQENEARERTGAIVAAAIEELNHNLVHVACAYSEGALTELPQITIDSTALLLDPENRARFRPEVVGEVEPIRRNAERLEEFRVRLQQDPKLDPMEADPTPLGGLVRCMFGAIYQLWGFHHDWSADAASVPELQDLGRIEQHPGALFVYRSSLAQKHGPQLRTDQYALICWIDDEPVQGVTTYELQSRYRDAVAAHQPHP